MDGLKARIRKGAGRWGVNSFRFFSEWAKQYDETVKGKDEEYREVFLHYPELLANIAEKAGDSVIEFGSGTGNLTLELIRRKENSVRDRAIGCDASSS